MISINAVRLQNLRSIEDTGRIELKPITILVGRNSSGKSTFARVFPLLRQSTEATKRGPILWWGRLVDFGSFDDAFNRYATNKEIGLDFSISFAPDDLRMMTRRGLGRLSMQRVLQPGMLEIALRFMKGESNTYTSSISISVFDFHAQILLDEQGFVREIKSGAYSWKPTNQTVCYAPQDRLIPRPAFFKTPGGTTDQNWEFFDPFGIELQKILRNFVHGNTAEERVRQLSNKISLGPRIEMFRYLSQIPNPPSFRETLQHYSHNSQLFKRLCDVFFCSQLEVMLDQINNSLNSFLGDVIYLEPLRATAQRYYRQQSLAVEEIDSKGENIAMYLDSLPPSELKDFQKWTSSHFGIEVAPRKVGGHISLTVTQAAGGAEANIADMGFGFSQMLPIAAQLWAASASRSTALPTSKRSRRPLVVIEQPELHLHPEYQAKLAGVFAAAIREQSNESSSYSRGELRIIAETHSPALINQLGAMIADNMLDRDDVQVVLFEQEDSQSPSKVRIAEFDHEGILQNWPIGFFEPSIAS